MGFNVTDVLSDESHYSEFLCVFCRDLADDAHVLPCSHVFCRFCLQQWIVRAAKRGESAEAPTCPSCRSQQILNEGDIRPLSEANPLAARILGRVRCRCPLAAQGCSWRGDYSEVHAHLTNSEEHLGCSDAMAHSSASRHYAPTTMNLDDATMAATPQQTTRQQDQAALHSRRSNANALKAQADAKYVARAYAQAAALYGKAIDLAPDVASFWANRAACAFMEQRYGDCIADCNRALQLEPGVAKVARRKARAQIELSSFQSAASGLALALAAAATDNDRRALSDEAKIVAALEAEIASGLRLLRHGEFKSALSSFSRALKSTMAVIVVLGAAIAELGNGHLDRALRLTMQVLTRADATAFRSTVCAVRGITVVLQDDGDVQNGIALLREAVRLDPDDDSFKDALRAVKRCYQTRQNAKSLVLRRDFHAAAEQYDELLESLSSGDCRRPATDASSDAPEEEKDPMQHGGDYVDSLRLLSPPFALLARATPLVAQLRAERANCHLRLGDYAVCLRDCAFALYTKDDCLDAHLTRAAALRATGCFDDALAELGGLMDRWGHHDVRVRHAYETTEFEARKAKRPDYYAILGCRKVSTDKEIKAAYYRRSREHHPDRHVNDDSTTRAQHEQAFKLIGEALEVLDDPNKRRLYDEGHDKAAIDECVLFVCPQLPMIRYRRRRIAAAERAAKEHSYHRGHSRS